MPLPNLATPEFKTYLPSTNEPITFRPFLIKEEKVLLMAQEGKDPIEIKNAVINLLKSCILTEVNIENLPLFDIEFLFLQLRMKSVGEVVSLHIKHIENKECMHSNKYELNLEEVKIHFDPEHKNIINLKDGVGVEMNYPSINMFDQMDVTQNTSMKAAFNMVSKCVKHVFDKDMVYSDFTEEELNDFLGKLDQKQFSKLINFFETIPKLKHKIKFKCSKCGDDIEYELNSLNDFFL